LLVQAASGSPAASTAIARLDRQELMRRLALSCIRNGSLALGP